MGVRHTQAGGRFEFWGFGAGWPEGEESWRHLASAASMLSAWDVHVGSGGLNRGGQNGNRQPGDHNGGQPRRAKAERAQVG